MPRVTVVPFKWYHIKAMDLREAERGYFASMDDYIERAKIHATRGPCYSIVVEGEGIACCWGMIEMWRGVYECWMLTSTIVDQYPVNMIRKSRICFNLAAVEVQARRLQMTVKASAQQSIRFAQALMFEQEGVLKAYGPDGSDYIMMARINHVGTVQQAG